MFSMITKFLNGKIITRALENSINYHLVDDNKIPKHTKRTFFVIYGKQGVIARLKVHIICAS